MDKEPKLCLQCCPDRLQTMRQYIRDFLAFEEQKRKTSEKQKDDWLSNGWNFQNDANGRYPSNEWNTWAENVGRAQEHQEARSSATEKGAGLKTLKAEDVEDSEMNKEKLPPEYNQETWSPNIRYSTSPRIVTIPSQTCRYLVATASISSSITRGQAIDESQSSEQENEDLQRI